MEHSQSATPVAGPGEQDNTSNTDIPLDLDTSFLDSDLRYSQSFPFAVDESCPELSTPITNSDAEHFIPRDIISSNISRTKLQSELMRPLIAGTYCGRPAYLLKLQFQFQVPEGGRNWFSRIKVASISIALEDAPAQVAVKEPPGSKAGRKKKSFRSGTDGNNPTIVKTYPGPEGFEGRIPTTPATNSKKVRTQSYDHAHARSQANAQAQAHPQSDESMAKEQDFTEEDTSTAKVETMRTGKQREKLIVTLTETNGVGIPSFLVVPLILTHQSRRFSMRVTVNATFGLWRGLLADNIPVLGGADEPLFFDPAVLQKLMEGGARSAGGEKVVEWGDKLEEVDLQLYSSLTDSHTS